MILLLGGVALGSLPPAEPQSPARIGLTRSSAMEEDSDLLFSSGAQGDESSKGKIQSLRVEEQPSILIRKNSLDRQIERNQSDPIAKSAVRIKPFRLGILGTATAGTGFMLKDYYDRIWWEGQPQKFHFNNDFGALRLTDKLGHAY
ncbi:hypothetical protein IIA15_01950, partial [candidate division TA06 bacterium]|nr:hypothetical protein [candidate division TA06 bacterium]